MSQRTIVEINHDLTGFEDVDDAIKFVVLLKRAIASGSPEGWALLERWGFKRVVQLHHSEDRKVVTKYGEYSIG